MELGWRLGRECGWDDGVIVGLGHSFVHVICWGVWVIQVIVHVWMVNICVVHHGEGVG